MSQHDCLCLSVHRFERGIPQPLGNARLRWLDIGSAIDEELLEVETGDGGEASVTGGGPGGWGFNTTFADIDVGSLSPELATLVFEYALGGEFLIAHWPPDISPGHKYAWEVAESPPDYQAWVAEEGFFIRSTPLSVFAVPADFVRDAPPDWPTPLICSTGSDLYAALSQFL